MQAPEILELEWGKIAVEDLDRANQEKQEELVYKDVKLFPGGSRVWDWNETGTRHRPGVQPADVQELIDQGAQVLVLSKGFWQFLKIQDETLQYLQKQNIPVHLLATPQAKEQYNHWVHEREKVGALIHSTC